MINSSFSFETPKLPNKNSLDKLSFDDFYELDLSDLGLPDFPPKSLLQIVELVENRRGQEVHIFEWLEVLESREQWDGLDTQQNQRALIAIWTGIGIHPIVSDIALFKIGLVLDGRASSIVHEITDSMKVARSVPMPHKITTLKLDWLISLQQKLYTELALQAFEDNSTIKEYIQKLRLPLANNYHENVMQELTHCINTQHISDFEDNWIYENFIDIKVNASKVNFCQSLILAFENDNISDLCNEIIEKNCLPTQSHSYWTRLNSKARHILKQKYHLTSYYDLQSISATLYSEDTIEELGFNEDDIRQIRSRSKFWSNYSEKFNRVRVLLPQESYNFVQSHNDGVPEFVEVLQPFSENVEVYIFELDRLMVVEFLRGNIAETRFFKPDNRLFDNSSLSIESIRAMPQLEVHDHLILWQYFCERQLRSQYDIHPNESTTKFQGMSREFGFYVQGKGLPTPSSALLEQRKTALEIWLKKFWEAEISTGKYGRNQETSSKGSILLSQAMLAKYLGQMEQFRSLVKQAAEKGNPEAMYTYGQALLRTQRSNQKAKLAAEVWIVKAAKVGHQAAENFARKFRLNMDIHIEKEIEAENDKVKAPPRVSTMNIRRPILQSASDRQFLLSKKANEGSVDAMYDLGEYLLHHSGDGFGSRLIAEKWIARAASNGHPEAIKTAQRLRIKFK